MITDKDTNEFYIKLLDIFKGSNAIAYRYFNESYAYRDMYSRMLKLNSVLSKYRHSQIVLYATKKFPAYAGIFSIFLSGNTWLPLSTDTPVARNMDILELADPRLVIHEGNLPGVLLDYFVGRKVDVVSFEQIFSEGAEEEFAVRSFKRDDIAYIMFTSGSTGIPKGVPMTHENYINFVKNVLEILPLGKNEVFSDFHEFAFDISIFSLFACVFTEGAFSPIIEQRDKIIPINHILENGVTIWSSVPSVINRIKTFRPKDKVETPIKIMFLCGEPLKFDVLKYCFNNMALDNVYNFYGLTETGVENFHHRCVPQDLEKYVNFGMAPIGKPLPGNYVTITNDKELCIGGCQISPGYLGNASPEKFEVIDNVRWCRTGDIVEKYDEVYFCKGRLDAQVKLSGYRVELMDIEAHIAKQDSVSQVVCFVNEGNARTTLVAVIKPESGIDFKAIQKNLEKELPTYMIPKDYMILENFPLNINGKVDRKKIREMYQNR